LSGSWFVKLTTSGLFKMTYYRGDKLLARG